MALHSQTRLPDDETTARKRGRPRKQLSPEEQDALEEARETAEALAADEADEEEDEEGMEPGDFGGPISMPDPEPSVSVPAPPSEAEQAFDLFVDVGQYWLNAGALVEYTIFKDNRQHATKHHPYSWSKLQEEFGEGYYKVQARDAKKKTFLKQESRLLGSLPKAPEKTEPVDPVKALLQRQLEPQIHGGAPVQQNPGLSISEVLAFMDKAESKAKAAADAQMGMMMGFMEKLMSAQRAAAPAESAAAKTDDTVLTLMRDQIARQEKIIEKLTDKLDEAAQRGRKDGGEKVTAMDLLKIQQDAEKAAFDRWQQLEEMAERKADEKLESRGEGGGDDKDESLMKTVVKSLVPALGAAYQQSQQGYQPAPVQQSAPRPAAQPVQPNNTRSTYPSRKRLPSAAPSPVSAIPSPAPKPQTPVLVPKAEAVPTTEDLNMSTREKVFNLAGPMIARMLPSGVAPDTAAKEVLDVLSGEGIQPLDVITIFPLDAFMGMAKAKGVPAIANPWLRKFHAAIDQIAHTPKVEPVATEAPAAENEADGS